MRVLVTGHKGFVGHYFYRHYKDQGHSVLGIDIVGKRKIDARDFFRTSDVKFDLVIHCAAVVGGRMTIDHDPLAVAVDLAIDAEMFQWAMRTKVGRVVYFSSSAVYPTHLQNQYCHPLTEHDQHIGTSHFGSPDMTYGWTKLTGEYQAKFLRDAGIPVHIFRPFSGYGPSQSLDYPFPSFIERAKFRMNPFEIWGDGGQVRDFVHIDDIVGTVLKAIEENFTHTLNIGTGRPTSFNQLAKLVCEEAGYHPTVLHHLDKPVGVRYRFAEPALMESLRIPKVSLEEGIARAFAK